ncbi:MAG: hypothetical protein KAU94_09325 [Verrucomicrobia bacterium]|nr:hypothetical protein [Verrucomicrobiota bacterium]
MKRIGHLFEKVVETEPLHPNIERIWNELLSGEYRHFTVYDPKTRRCKGVEII